MTMLHDINGAPVIVGGGIAGLMTALALAPQPVAAPDQGAARL